MSDVDFDKNERETMRWRLLKVLAAGSPWPVSEGLAQVALEDAALRVSPAELRKQLQYLADKGLLVIHGKDGPVWQGQLTSAGTDVVEFAAVCPAGIRRPAKWY